MSAAAKLQAMLDVGMGLIPDLVRGAAGIPGGGEADAPAPDLEGYLKSVDQAARTQLSINRLREDEMNQPAQAPGELTPEAALERLLSASVAFRLEAVARLTASTPQKGMK